MDKIELRYKHEIEKDGDYEYIRRFRQGDILPNGKVVKRSPYIRVKHKYCGSVYETNASGFINNGYRCRKCCRTYERSFAYHIEVELGEPLEKYWDFEKNTLSPYHISKNKNTKVWIKCQAKDYHGSYEVSCDNFVNGKRCSYCGNQKVHPKDSFAAIYPDKAKCWHEDNDKSPYEVSYSSGKKYKFRCNKCDHVFDIRIDTITSQNTWCKNCRISKGEKRIKEYLDKRNIKYIHDQAYFHDLLGTGENPLRPDFILPDYNIWIEYDGEFHFKKMYDDDNYETLKIHDKRKDKYAEKHGWKMIRIPYWDFDNIEYILEKELK